MDIDELERRAHELIREIQEEYQQRVAPLYRVLAGIHNARPPNITLTREQAEKLIAARSDAGILDSGRRD